MRVGFNLSVSGTVEATNLVEAEQAIVNAKRQITYGDTIQITQLSSSVGDYTNNMIGGSDKIPTPADAESNPATTPDGNNTEDFSVNG